MPGIFIRVGVNTCMVLARNHNQLLPLDQERPLTLALIGPMAHEKRSLLGAWSGNGMADETASLVEVFQASSGQI